MHQVTFVRPMPCIYGAPTRVRPRFFDQVGHETMYASSGNKHLFTKNTLFSKMCPIFVGSVHNFGRSDGDII